MSGIDKNRIKSGTLGQTPQVEPEAQEARTADTNRAQTDQYQEQSRAPSHQSQSGVNGGAMRLWGSFAALMQDKEMTRSLLSEDLEVPVNHNVNEAADIDEFPQLASHTLIDYLSNRA